MKVALVSVFPNEPQRIVGGVAAATKYLADELVKLPDVSVTVLVPRGAPGPAAAREQWGALRVVRLPRSGLRRVLPGTLYDLAGGQRQVAAALDELAPDVAHFQGLSFLAAAASRPSVLTIHGIAERDALWDRRRGVQRWLKKGLLTLTESYGRRRSRNVILISDAVRSVLPPAAERRVWSIPNPVAESFFDVLRRPESGRVFCCSRVTPLKNVVGLIRAFAVGPGRRSGSELRVAGRGDPSYLADCRAEAEKLGVGGRVRFLGALSVAEVQEELARAAVFALPSFQENAPLSLAEAMAAGVPALAARVGGVPEMLEHGATGLLVDPWDVRDIAGGLSRLLEDERLAEGMGRRAEELAGLRYRASVVARQTVDVYRQLIAGN